MSNTCCEIHKIDKEVIGGCSAHESNWYCPECDAQSALVDLVNIYEGAKHSNGSESETLQNLINDNIRISEDNKKLEEKIKLVLSILRTSYFEGSQNMQEHFRINGVKEAIRILDND